MFESKDLEHHKGRYYGLYRAYVYDNKDPKNLGRIKVCCPSVYGVDGSDNPLVSDWAYPKFPVCGYGFGIQCIPPTKNPDGSNVLVWLEFEMGDKNKPVWSGGPVSNGGLQTDVLSNHKDKVNGTTTACCFSFTTPGGHKIILNDQSGEVTIQSKGKNKVVLNDKDGINIQSGKGHKINLDDNGSISIVSLGGNSITFDDKNKRIRINRETFPI